MVHQAVHGVKNHANGEEMLARRAATAYLPRGAHDFGSVQEGAARAKPLDVAGEPGTQLETTFHG